jgi:hypothetical protein
MFTDADIDAIPFVHPVETVREEVACLYMATVWEHADGTVSLMQNHHEPVHKWFRTVTRPVRLTRRY